MAANIVNRPPMRNVLRSISLAVHPFGSQFHVLAAPSTSSIHPPTDLSEQTRAVPKLSGSGPFPQEVHFEVLGNPFSLLSVSLPSSSTLYTRRGTLIGVNGKVENATSTLSILEPFRRVPLGIPFMYQKISSTTPLTCLLSTNFINSSFAVIKLEGGVDWMVIQRKALLAWSGHSLSVKPIIGRKLSLVHWGNSKITGRGLISLVGKGQIFQIVLQPGEEYIIHPSNLLAYSLNTALQPQQYRLHSHSFRLQTPNLGVSHYLSNIESIKAVVQSPPYKAISRAMFNIRLWARRVIWGDRQFLRFQGPVTILVQSRTSQIRDILTEEDIGDVAVTEPGVLTEQGGHMSSQSTTRAKNAKVTQKVPISRASLKVATVGGTGKVELADSDFKEFIRR